MHDTFMRAALNEAEKAFIKNEVPVGCVAVKNGKIIARAHNLRETLADPLAHAEIICMKKAAKKLGGWHLHKVALYTTLEPCLMCAGAIIHARIKEVYFGAKDQKSGSSKILIKNKVKTKKGILQKECGEIIKTFFKNLRRGARAAYSARLESVSASNGTVGSNPTLSE
ncbi:MAG: CMP/dCMP deaminase zinc-binding protein [Candidatus Saganbacteria bacterium]|uniref:tRNA-specific adenosine deaminase n=1 Tax=Candidatus Saganbacteria bacterium TaxID=2575572 RepID=A0A833L0X3_UNCSA|nr:MAG: CMP/dCMP deaminase zinc-binding protein [Candidatus Saganbacteria bacterium]